MAAASPASLPPNWAKMGSSSLPGWPAVATRRRLSAGSTRAAIAATPGHRTAGPASAAQAVSAPLADAEQHRLADLGRLIERGCRARTDHRKTQPDPGRG